MKWSRRVTWLGIVIALAGVVIGIWLQVTVSEFPGSFGTTERLQNAIEGLSMVGAGALLAVAAQIMGMMQTSRDQGST